jgi:hypothetical protein
MWNLVEEFFVGSTLDSGNVRISELIGAGVPSRADALLIMSHLE